MKRLIKSSTYQFIDSFEGEFFPRVIEYVSKSGFYHWADWDEDGSNGESFSENELLKVAKDLKKQYGKDAHGIEIIRDDGEGVFLEDFLKEGSFDKALKNMSEEDNWISSKNIRSGRTSEPVDSNSATSLYLYAKDSQNVYDRMIIPILENLSRKIKRGIYNGNKALNAFENIMDFAAQEYDRELGSGRGSLTLFNKATRCEAAKKLMESFEGDLYDMAGEVKSSLYKIYPTEGADNYQYKSFNSESEAEDFCKEHGYTKFEVINKHPFEKRINNSRAKRRPEEEKDFRLISDTIKEDPMVGKDLTEQELINYILEYEDYFDAAGLDYDIIYLPTGDEMSLADFDLRYIHPKKLALNNSRAKRR